MPNPGQANNPQGANGLYGVREEPQGAIKRLEQSTRAAPIPGNPALASPKRAQRRAVRGQPPQEQVAAQPPTDQVQQPMVAAQVWAQLASDPEAAQYPLLAEYAQRAAGGAQSA